LSDQVRRVSKAVNPESFRVSGFSIGTIAEHSGAKQRRYFQVFVFIRQVKAVAQIRDGELGIAAVDVVTGELRVVAKIFAIGSTICAFAIGPAEPWNSDTMTD
jgi:hypothetical protein